MKLKSLLFILCVIVLSGCWKKEDAWPLKVVGNSGTSVNRSLDMGSDYDKVYFYSLKDSSYKGALLADWDLSFDASEDGYHIFLNGGKGYLAAVSTADDMADILKKDGLTFEWDESGGFKDSTACGDWLKPGDTKSPVFVLDKGAAFKATERYVKFQVLSVDDTSYTITAAALEQVANFDQLLIKKDPTRNYVYLNLNAFEASPAFEPNKDEWDLEFTRYQYVYHDMTPPVPYVVTGVLINPNKVMGTKTTDKQYEDIDLAYAASLTLIPNRDVIGFNWKFYDFDKGLYVVNPDLVFILKSVDGNYYKFRFLDFYDRNGRKGNPSFQYQLLK